LHTNTVSPPVAKEMNAMEAVAFLTTKGDFGIFESLWPHMKAACHNDKHIWDSNFMLCVRSPVNMAMERSRKDD